MKEPDALLSIAERGVETAKRRGADAAEVFITETRRVRITWRGDLASPTESHAVGIGVRVAIGKRIGLAGSSGLHRLDQIVADAVDGAKDAPENPRFNGFPDPASYRPTPTPVPEVFIEPDPARLQEALVAATEPLDGPKTTFRSVNLGAGTNVFVVANSNGVAAWDQGGRESFDLELRVSGGGRHVTAWDLVSRITPLDPVDDLRTLSEGAYDRAVRALRPKPLDTPVDTVILTDAATAQIMTRFIAGFSGSSVRAGQSPLTGKFGEQVASRLVTIDDFRQDADDLVRLRVDHEGTPTRPLRLVDGGVAKDVLHDSLSGGDAGGSNGRGLRPRGWGGGVSVSPLFPSMAPGGKSLEDIIADTDRAVFIEEPMTGMLTANATTGDFSAVVPYAFLVENGEIAHALPNVTIGGNIHTAVQEIDAVGDTVTERRQGVYPAIRTRGVSCAT